MKGSDSMIKIAIDAMGGDYLCQTTVPACMEAVKEYKDLELVLYGDEKQIKPLLTNSERITIVHTEKYVDMGEHNPVSYIRRNKDASLCMAMQSAHDGVAQAVVSAGPTQCVVCGAHLIIRKLHQIGRVGLCPIVPSYDKRGRLMLDVGANVELRPEHIRDLAYFATTISREILHVPNPRVGLLNIGTEPGKGREVDQETYKMLDEDPLINFYGNVETKDILTSPCDIFVTDGFTGNMVMKTVEGTAKTMGDMLKQEIKSSLGGIIGYLFMHKALKRFKKRLDSSEVGGAMIVGVPVPVVKSHGSSNAYAFKNAIGQARMMVETDLINKVIAKLPKKDEENEAL